MEYGNKEKRLKCVRSFVIISEYAEIAATDVFNLFVEGMKCNGKKNSFSGVLVVDRNLEGFLFFKLVTFAMADVVILGG